MWGSFPTWGGCGGFGSGAAQVEANRFLTGAALTGRSPLFVNRGRREGFFWIGIAQNADFA